jgi:hypothetical protein
MAIFDFHSLVLARENSLSLQEFLPADNPSGHMNLKHISRDDGIAL